MAKQLARIADILAEISGLPPDLITPRTKLVRDLGLDSLMLAAFEHEMRIEFDLDLNIGRGTSTDISVQQVLDLLSGQAEE